MRSHSLLLLLVLVCLSRAAGSDPSAHHCLVSDRQGTCLITVQDLRQYTSFRGKEVSEPAQVKNTLHELLRARFLYDQAAAAGYDQSAHGKITYADAVNRTVQYEQRLKKQVLKQLYREHAERFMADSIGAIDYIVSTDSLLLDSLRRFPDLAEPYRKRAPVDSLPPGIQPSDIPSGTKDTMVAVPVGFVMYRRAAPLRRDSIPLNAAVPILRELEKKAALSESDYRSYHREHFDRFARDDSLFVRLRLYPADSLVRFDTAAIAPIHTCHLYLPPTIQDSIVARANADSTLSEYFFVDRLGTLHVLVARRKSARGHYTFDEAHERLLALADDVYQWKLHAEGVTRAKRLVGAAYWPHFVESMPQPTSSDIQTYIEQHKIDTTAMGDPALAAIIDSVNANTNEQIPPIEPSRVQIIRQIKTRAAEKRIQAFIEQCVFTSH